MTKIATVTFAVLVLGSSAALAQPYGYGRDNGRERDNGRGNFADYRRCYDQPYGPAECAQLRQRPDFQAFHDRNAANIVNWIIDPATNRPVTQQQYLARYPRSNPNTWNYDPATNLWTDLTAQNPGYDRDRDRDRDRERERERERDRDRDRDR